MTNPVETLDREAALKRCPSLEDAETPAGIVDLDRVRANLARISRYHRLHGLSWRPHVKTHKSKEIARMQLEAGASGLCAATLREAEVCSEVCSDILLAYPPVGAARIKRLSRLAERARISVALDSMAAARPLAKRLQQTGARVRVLVEVDAGARRTGVGAPADAVRIAKGVDALPGMEFEGLLFYPGHLRMRAEKQKDGIRALSRCVTDFREALAAVGLAPRVVSGGSTPTLWSAHLVEGMTETRAGTCVFFDRDIVQMGVASLDDVAYTVLATVVSVAVPGQAVVDAGSKALSKEPFRSGPGGREGGFGILLNRPQVRLRTLNEEHGMLDLAGTSWRPRVGDRLRIVPNHVCLSVNLQDRLWAESQGELSLLELEARGRGLRLPQHCEVASP